MFQITDRVLVTTVRASQATLNGKVGIVRGYQGKMNGEEMFRVEFKDGRVRTFLASELELWFRIGVK